VPLTSSSGLIALAIAAALIYNLPAFRIGLAGARVDRGLGRDVHVAQRPVFGAQVRVDVDST
jgi:hypothetical protein